MITINGTKKQAAELIKEMKDFIANRKLMLSDCQLRREQLINGLFKAYGQEYTEKSIAIEDGFIERISEQIKYNSEILNELETAYRNQFE